jgi:hypothetical protein
MATKKKPVPPKTPKRATAKSAAKAQSGNKAKAKPKSESAAKKKSPAQPEEKFVPAAVPPELSTRMEPPASGVKIRMYRQGHGDCFLLAFPKTDGEAFYILIDCGMKKGSSLTHSITQVAENIRDATDGHIHLAAITHEHEDHVSGFLSEQEVFGKLTIDKLWLAWTEDPGHELANRLREKYKDVLLGLLSAEKQLNGVAANSGQDAKVQGTVDALLGFELSEESRGMGSDELQAKIKGRTNKEGILVVKARADANQGTVYLRPHTAPQTIPALPGVRFFVLGPPENELSLKDMDPQGDEQFHFAVAEERSFLAALAGGPIAQEAFQPFAVGHRIVEADAEKAEFFESMYYAVKSPAGDDQKWRRIDGDWLRSSETFALRMNTYINNTSLVLAIELPNSKRVALMVGDAQRGNWVSWHEKTFPDGDGGQITAAELLGRTVFYKVGHHGSHNATLNKKGVMDMAAGRFADEFVAMIPANEKWATTKNDPPWMHPLKEIYNALLNKAKARVFVMDREFQAPFRKTLSTADWDAHLAKFGTNPAEWKSFLKKAVVNNLFYEFTIDD